MHKCYSRKTKGAPYIRSFICLMPGRGRQGWSCHGSEYLKKKRGKWGDQISALLLSGTLVSADLIARSVSARVCAGGGGRGRETSGLSHWFLPVWFQVSDAAPNLFHFSSKVRR